MNKEQYPLEGVIAIGLMKIFESKKIKKQLSDVSNDEDWKKIVKEHTLQVEVDLSGLTQSEITSILLSQTSLGKMIYNNLVGKWNEAEIKKQCASGTYKMNGREILDSRKSRTLSPEQKKQKHADELIKNAGSIEAAIALLKSKQNQ